MAFFVFIIHNIMFNRKYSYSSLHIGVPGELSQEIYDWGIKKIPDKILYRGEYGLKSGREDDVHITVLYGICTESVNKIEQSLEGEKPIEVEIDKIDLFITNQKYDVIKLNVLSQDLYKLNSKLDKSLEHVEKYEKFEPHITLAYVNKNSGWKYFGFDKFKGKRFVANEIIFSPRIENKQKILLAGS